MLALVIGAGLVQTAIRFHHYHLGLVGDDFDFLLKREGLSVHSLLAPHNENLVVVGVLLYKAIFAFVGISTAVPYIGLLFLSVGACAALAYVFVRRELGPWLALIVPLLLVTLGPAGEALLWPEFILPSALAFWLAAMLVIERADTRSDLIGCALLILAVGSQAIAVALLPATALALVLWRGWRRALRRAWIVAVPLLLFATWHLVYRSSEELRHSLAKVPGFVLHSFVAAVADISGVGHHSPYTGVLAAAVILAVCFRCLHLRRVPTTTAYMTLGLLSVWLANGLIEGGERVPGLSRYQFHDSLLLMLALAPLVPRPGSRRRLHRRLASGVVLVALVGGIVTLNLNRYGPFEVGLHSGVAWTDTEFAALQIARPAVADPSQLFNNGGELGPVRQFRPKAYYAAIDAHGSPVQVRQDLELAPPAQRALADRVLVRLEKVSFRPGFVGFGSIRPRSASGVALRPAGAGCSVLPAGAAALSFYVVAPAGGLIIRPAAGLPVNVGVTRFADPSFAVELPSVLAGTAAVIPVRPDASAVPWRLRLLGQQAMTLCSLAE